MTVRVIWDYGMDVSDIGYGYVYVSMYSDVWQYVIVASEGVV